ncbi:UNVERIFIED_CONTAM: hypothetical protein Sangu_1725700 [Sesamum angustifolium]|uniref:CCHC-type domain-containing protein n=1 Tax=Sesamum angustifolium TaxID=2727405 RepID=A0AAW2M4R1_9LAMI
MLVLAPVEAADDPKLIDLNWCDFHIHIHGLPLGKMNQDVASYIGRKLGKVKEVDKDSSGDIWGSSVRIRVSIDITKPLKRALKLRTVLGDEHLVTFTYERLPNFCYLCGCLGHLARQCETQLQDDFRDPRENSPYGNWLCAALAWLVAPSLPPGAPFNPNQSLPLLTGVRPYLVLLAPLQQQTVLTQLRFSRQRRLHQKFFHLPPNRLSSQVARPWRFKEAWLQSPQCEQVVAAGWSMALGDSRMTGITNQIACCQAKLKQWSKTTFCKDKKRVQLLESKLGRLLQGPFTPESNADIAAIRKELESFAAHEETAWRQRSKILWLWEGDRNTGFFHRKASYRFRTSSILRIRNLEGDWVYMEDDIRNCISSYFGTVYASTYPSLEAIAKGTEHVRTIIDASMRDDLLQPFTASEVTKALFEMASLKSPGPDAIANRMKPILDRIISPSQSAFVPGRLISDNILLAFELNHFLNSKSRGEQGWMALKLDVSKAYDKVEWSFLEQKLSALYCSRLRRRVGLGELRFVGVPLQSRTFCQASLESSLTVREILDTYQGASGQEINFSKSSMAFSRNTKEDMCCAITSDLTIR